MTKLNDDMTLSAYVQAVAGLPLQELIELQRDIAENDVSVAQKAVAKRILTFLEELQMLRVTGKASCKTIQPATAFLNNLPGRQLLHIKSENLEELKAYKKFDKELAGTDQWEKARWELGMELIDGQVTRETMLHILFSAAERLELMQQVIDKNTKRGYYREAK